MTLEEFLERLAALTRESGFAIGGCGDCGSPWSTGDGTDPMQGTRARDLEWDGKTETYVYGA